MKTFFKKSDKTTIVFPLRINITLHPMFSSINIWFWKYSTGCSSFRNLSYENETNYIRIQTTLDILPYITYNTNSYDNGKSILIDFLLFTFKWYWNGKTKDNKSS